MEGGGGWIVKIHFIIGMFLINAKPIFCSESKSFSNKFSYLLICKPLRLPRPHPWALLGCEEMKIKISCLSFLLLDCFLYILAMNVMESFKVLRSAIPSLPSSSYVSELEQQDKDSISTCFRLDEIKQVLKIIWPFISNDMPSYKLNSKQMALFVGCINGLVVGGHWRKFCQRFGVAGLKAFWNDLNSFLCFFVIFDDFSWFHSNFCVLNRIWLENWSFWDLCEL